MEATKKKIYEKPVVEGMTMLEASAKACCRNSGLYQCENTGAIFNPSGKRNSNKDTS